MSNDNEASKPAPSVEQDERGALLTDYIELSQGDVDRLNDWAIRAYDFIKRAASTSANVAQWKQAIDDELVMIESTADSFETPRKAVKALIDWHVSVALDPAVSREAQALIDKGKAASANVAQGSGDTK